MQVDDLSVLVGCPWSDLWSGDENAAVNEAIESATQGTPTRFVGNATTLKDINTFWDVQVTHIFEGDDMKD
ncbi:hypothetical protein [Oryzifoliimicrobium ureilyticus]|uniref:hypothetical protein n=1 Tax=Oryzifoliimicrobium ureilyticus TaxID=3113724 RepID=UPI0030768007